jgi:predicted nucleotidyltransferase
MASAVPLHKIDDPTPEARFADVLRNTVAAVEGAGVSYVLIGGVGSATLGRPRWTRDIDLLVAPIDADRTLAALGSAGFETERTNEHWIFKATQDKVTVDIIFRTVGDIYLDDEMLERTERASFLGVDAMVAPPEDQIVIKAIAHDEQSSRHWNDALSLLTARELDWDYLCRRAARGPRRVLSLLIYAQSNDLVVPEEAITRLFRTIYSPEATGAR